jgi:hypothetical protein
MLNKLILAAALLTLPAAADMHEAEHDYAPACTAPAAPGPFDGAATQAQLDAGRAAVKDFMAASDSYQRCLGRALGAQHDTAFYMHSNIPRHIARQIEGRAAANQKQKETVAASYNAAATAHRAGER